MHSPRQTPLGGAARSMSRRGLTLVETLVSVMVIGILVSLLMSSVSSVRNAAGKAQLANNLRQTVAGIQGFAAENNNILPGSSGHPSTGGDNSWQAAIAPYLGEHPSSTWYDDSTIARSVLHDPMDRKRKSAGAKRLIRNIAINGVNRVGEAPEGIVNRNLASIRYPSQLLAVTTGRDASFGDEYGMGVMRIRGTYFRLPEDRKTYTRIPGFHYCGFVDGHADLVTDAFIEAEYNKGPNSLFFDPRANNGNQDL